MSIEYVIPPRLLESGGQIMQGDVFRDISFGNLLPGAGEDIVYAAGILLTPTCDFALKGSHPERQLAPVEALPAAARDGVVRTPHHLLFLPPLQELLPYGGVLHFRRIVTIHADALVPANRPATLNASGLRALLAAQTTYYTRSAVDPTEVPLTADDPRLLWEAIDRARSCSKLSAMRAGLERTTAIAIRALLYHHGLRTDSPAQSLVLLEELSRHGVFPEGTAGATGILTGAQSTLKGLYALLPARLSSQVQRMQNLATELEEVGRMLQEPHPLQVTSTLLREHRLENILPR